MLRRSALLLAALAGVLLVSGCVAVQPQADGTNKYSLVMPGDTPTGSVTSGSSGSASVPQQKKLFKGAGQGGLAMIGTSLTTGPWKVQVDSIEKPTSLPDGTKPAAGKEFWVLNISVTNVGTSQALIVRPQQFVLADVQGAPIKPFPTSMSAFNAQQVKPVEVGTGGYTKFIYEMTPGTTNLRFIVTPAEPGAPGSLTWAVP
jgi:hypothetical protein